MSQFKVYRFVCVSLALILCCALVGCSGGGSEGTGGGTLIKGFISDSDGLALSDVSVAIAATGESDTTDNEGQYSIQSNSTFSGNTDLSVTSLGGVNATITIDIPVGASELTVDFNIGADGSVSIQAISTPTPTPSATPRAANNDPAFEDDSGNPCRAGSGREVCRPNVPTPVASPTPTNSSGGSPDRPVGTPTATPTPTPTDSGSSGAPGPDSGGSSGGGRPNAGAGNNPNR